MPQTIQGEVSKNIVMGVAITLFIFAISAYMPIIGFFCVLFIPLPVLFYRSKLGRKNGLIIAGVSVLMIAVITGRLSFDVLLFVELMLLGFVLSELMEQELSVEKTVVFASATVLLAGIICLIFYGNMSQTGVTTLISEYVGKNLRLTIMLYENMGVSEENIRVFSNQLENIIYVLVRMLPAMAVSSTLFISWTTLLISKPILRNKGLFYPDFGSLKLWKAPDALVWGVIGCGGSLLFLDKTFKILALNGLIILMTIYFFGGISIISFYFEKKRFPLMLRFFLYSLIALQQFVLLFVIGLGFFDLWLNFRKLETEERP